MQIKPIIWVASSKDDLESLPEGASGRSGLRTLSSPDRR